MRRGFLRPVARVRNVSLEPTISIAYIWSNICDHLGFLCHRGRLLSSYLATPSESPVSVARHFVVALPRLHSEHSKDEEVSLHCSFLS